MTDAEVLMAAIAADPDNDLPRLVYADYLEEHGDPDRAEFIRIQCEQSRLWRSDDSAVEEAAALNARERQLLKANRKSWHRQLTELGADFDTDVGMIRGFPEYLSMSATDFVANGPELFRRVPVIKLDLSCDEASAADLAVTPEFARVRRLVLWGRDTLSSIGAHTILRSAYFRADHLELQGVGLHGDGILEVVEHKQFSGVKELGLMDVTLEAVEWSAFLSAFPRLKRLWLSELHGISESEIAEIIAAVDATALTDLWLQDLAVGGRGMRAITSPHFAGLRRLTLWQCGLTAAEVSTLAAADHLTGIHVLALDDNSIGDEGVAMLATWPGLASVKRLGLRNCGIGPHGVAALLRSPHLRELEALFLDRNPIGDVGVAELIRSPVALGLRELDLGECQISSVVCEMLAGAEWVRLRGLELSDNPIGHAASYLAAAPRLRTLHRLDLSRCQVPEPITWEVLDALPDLKYFVTDRDFYDCRQLQMVRRELRATSFGCVSPR